MHLKFLSYAYLDVPISSYENVGSLNVSMNNAQRVDVSQSLDNLSRNKGDCVVTERLHH